MRSWIRGGIVVGLLLATAAAAQAQPRDPIPPAQRNAARIAQLRADAQEQNRAGDFEKTMAALEEIARLDATSAEAQHTVAAFYWEKAYKDANLAPDRKKAYIRKGIAFEDAALGLNSQYVDAMVYKNLLLRLLANDESDPAEQKRLLAEADALRARAMELRQTQSARYGAPPSGAPAPPPPPPPPGGLQPVRVGGNIAAPTKIRDVKPVYPPEAQAARVSGVVICEVVIGTDGKVTDVRVLRSIPLLDAAAIEAVRQWEFTPTLLNGTPVPVIMTATVNFTLTGW